MSVDGARLVVHEETGRRVVPVTKEVFTIGRRPGNDLLLSSSEVSRDHAEIVSSHGRLVLRDRESRYGTFVNGSRIAEHVLAAGDQIECGRNGPVIIFAIGERRTVTADDGGTVGDLRQVAALLDTLRAMGSERVLDEVLALVLDSAIAATGAERGFIMLANGEDALELTLARGAGHQPLPATRFEMSRKIPEEVFATGKMVAVSDLLEGDLPIVHTGTVALGIRHVLCAPLRLVRYVDRGDTVSARSNIGVLYLDSRSRGTLLSSSARASLETLAAEAASAIENARLYREALEKARLDQQLRTAARIQQALLPSPRRSGGYFTAVGSSVPSLSIGGDFFDYLDLDNGRFGFVLGDVTGKGPAAALLSSMVQGILASHASSTSSPAGLVTHLNRVLLSRRIESRYVTVFFGALAPDGTLHYCNAAQNPPLVFGAGGVRPLDVGGTLVGAFAEARFEQGVVQLAPGDTLVLFSDGIVEALSVSGEDFGEERIRQAVAAALPASPERVLQALLDAVHAFAQGAPQHDDLTAVVLRYA